MIKLLGRIMFGIREDDREEYYTTVDGQPLALLVEGESVDDIGLQYRTPDHESFVHDGTPHRDPAVYNRQERRWFLGFIPYTHHYQQRYYPLTVSEDGRHADLDDLIEQIEDAYIGSGQSVRLAVLDEDAQRRTERQESRLQRARGVPWWLLRPNRSKGELE